MPEIFKDLKVSYFGTLAIAIALMAFSQLLTLFLIAIYVAVDLIYLSKRTSQLPPALEQLHLNLGTCRMYILLGGFIMPPFNSLLFVGVGSFMIGFWGVYAYTLIRRYEAAEAARLANEANDSNDA